MTTVSTNPSALLGTLLISMGAGSHTVGDIRKAAIQDEVLDMLGLDEGTPVKQLDKELRPLLKQAVEDGKVGSDKTRFTAVSKDGTAPKGAKVPAKRTVRVQGTGTWRDGKMPRVIAKWEAWAKDFHKRVVEDPRIDSRHEFTHDELCERWEALHKDGSSVNERRLFKELRDQHPAEADASDESEPSKKKMSKGKGKSGDVKTEAA